MTPLTDRQLAVMRAIDSLTTESGGAAPTLEAVAQLLGVERPTIHRHVFYLKCEGWLLKGKRLGWTEEATKRLGCACPHCGEKIYDVSAK